MPKVAYILPAHGTYPFDFIRKNPRIFGASEDFVGSMYQMLKEWPRTAQTDPFMYEQLEWAERLKKRSDYDVVEVGFWSFTPPYITEAVKKMADQGVDRIITFVTNIVNSGHALHEVPKILERTKKAVPDVELVYLPPPYDENDVTDLLQKHMEKGKDPMRW